MSVLQTDRWTPAGPGEGGPGFRGRLSRLLVHPVVGIVVYAAVMALLFTAIFFFARPLMDLVDAFFVWTGVQLGNLLPDAWVSRLLTDGIVTGVGALSVFLPQILILFLLLGFLEDSGYLARGTAMIDRLLVKAGLSGRSFSLMLTGFACAVPGTLATRTIENRRERLVTIAILPLMLCSARLPVYGLILAFLAPAAWVGGLAMTALYLMSASAGLIGAAVLGKILGRDLGRARKPLPDRPLTLPNPRVIGVVAFHRTGSYLKQAGPLILGIAALLWVMTHVPYRPEMTEQAQLAASWAGQAALWLDPVMAPLGLDWRVGIALMCAVAGREVFVSALALVLMATPRETRCPRPCS